ncbi:MULTISPECIES: oxygen-insensitive NAD(P)H nitroreductase [unclassified Stenotrophomonas]|uniref:oxygen-insensitive NAD(P)H nitroreductase n=1 Tax=unclassified Stenotrophomonas TaxID=196198 RepID=UPI00211949BF|nr:MULTISPECIES: oxygen-insensitive NAD(P)H nitroreductase [unclassified Stenotrophomonas]
MTLAPVARRRHTTKAYDPTRTLPPAVLHDLLDVLHHAPSSVNSQPWHFLVAASDAARARIARATQPHQPFNTAKITDASHVIVFATRTSIDDAYLAQIIEQETADGRYPSDEAREGQRGALHHFVDLHRHTLGDVEHWMQKQTYLALGTLLLAAGVHGVDATPMEGFDAAVLDAELGLRERGLTSVVLVALGYGSEANFNADLPKSRLPREQVFTHL